jgi:hypothetical protein
VVDKKERPAMPLSCPRPVQKLIAECWDHEAAARPSFEAIIDRCQDLLKEC